MDLVYSAIISFAGVLGILGIYAIYKYNNVRKHNGKLVLGKMIKCEEVWGRPIRYVVEVEYQLDNEVYSKKIVTADRKIKKYANGQEIPLLYVDTIDRIFWAEDNSKESLVCIILLISFCAFMFSLAGFFFIRYWDRYF